MQAEADPHNSGREIRVRQDKSRNGSQKKLCVYPAMHLKLN